jgi:uncharacterized protein
MTQRPVPVPDEVSAPYWRAAAEGRLVLARCARCRRFCHPPAVVCPNCGSTTPDFAFDEVAGNGSVRSWTVLHQASLAGFEDDVPFVLVDIELDLDAEESPEQPQPTSVRMIGRLLDGPDAELRLGDAVTLAFEHLGDGSAVPAFTLVRR